LGIINLVLVFVSAPECRDMHRAGGVHSLYVYAYVRGTYHLQCTCGSNGNRELHSY